MSYVSWGKNAIYNKNVEESGGKWEEMPTPVEDSSELSTTEGDKLEAPIEGGELEDVKYKAATYELKYDIRNTKGKAIPIEHKNGVVEDHYATVVVPEDEECIACYIPKSSVSVSTSYTAADGFKSTFTHSALVPDDKAESLQLGKVEISKSESGGVDIKFYPIKKDGSYETQAITI